MYVPFSVFCVLSVCKCVLYYCHWVATPLLSKINKHDYILCRLLRRGNCLSWGFCFCEFTRTFLKTVTHYIKQCNDKFLLNIHQFKILSSHFLSARSSIDLNKCKIEY
jgi:hypothetical protein